MLVEKCQVVADFQHRLEVANKTMFFLLSTGKDFDSLVALLATE